MTTFNQPEWITEELNSYDIIAMRQGGRDSGAYMPAVTYYQAIETMSKHGDKVMEYVSDALGDEYEPDSSTWGTLCVSYLSCAVELWCMSQED